MFYSNLLKQQNNPTQIEQARPDQVLNNAGGFVFEITIWSKLDRFLILGSENGTYYVSPKQHTKNNFESLDKCLNEDYKRTIDRIVEISVQGRAPKNDHALVALAKAASHPNVEARQYALSKLNDVARTGTHLFQFIGYVKEMRGFGRRLKTAIANWYLSKDPDKLAYQCVKYRNRNSWTHKDVLRLCHPKSKTHEPIFRWLTNSDLGERVVKRNDVEKTYPATSSLPKIIQGFELAKTSETKDIPKLIKDYKLTHEMIDNKHFSSPEVWEALLEHMPLTAMIRSLAKMTNVGLVKPLSNATNKIINNLRNEQYIKNSKIHPISVLLALNTYSRGRGDKGSLTWNPVQNIISALNDAFCLSFTNVIPTNKRTLIALDVSGSMRSNVIENSNLSARDISAAMAMIVARTEPQYEIMAFSNKFIKLNISGNKSLNEVIKTISELPFEATNCSLPMLWALKNKISVDSFVVYTDNETYARNVHPYKAIKDYREKMNIPKAKLAVMGITATDFSIADPNDAGMMDFVGFDSSSPALLADFLR